MVGEVARLMGRTARHSSERGPSAGDEQQLIAAEFWHFANLKGDRSMAKKQTAAKVTIVRPTARCGDNEAEFTGLGSVMLSGNVDISTAGRIVTDLACADATRKANGWIDSLTCSVRCFIKSWSIRIIQSDPPEEPEIVFQIIGSRGITFASVNCVVRATVTCSETPFDPFERPHTEA